MLVPECGGERLPMILFPCPVCGKELRAADDLAGTQTACDCGAVTPIPVELVLEEGPVSADANTMTVAEIRALRART